MNYDHPMWNRLQDLKIRVLKFSTDENKSWEERDYWWQHYMRLDRLQGDRQDDIPF